MGGEAQGGGGKGREKWDSWIGTINKTYLERSNTGLRDEVPSRAETERAGAKPTGMGTAEKRCHVSAPKGTLCVTG